MQFKLSLKCYLINCCVFLQDIVLPSENIIVFIIVLSLENHQGNCGIWCITERTHRNKAVRLLRHTPCALLSHGHVSNFLYEEYLKAGITSAYGNG